MPEIRECPKCGFIGNHGFDITNGGMYYYHNGNKNGTGAPGCQYYIGNDNKVYHTAKDLFVSVVLPKTPKTKVNLIWIAARIADLDGHPRKAKRLYKQWNSMH